MMPLRASKGRLSFCYNHYHTVSYKLLTEKSVNNTYTLPNNVLSEKTKQYVKNQCQNQYTYTVTKYDLKQYWKV